jgi:hypothetical protein
MKKPKRNHVATARFQIGGQPVACPRCTAFGWVSAVGKPRIPSRVVFSAMKLKSSWLMKYPTSGGSKCALRSRILEAVRGRQICVHERREGGGSGRSVGVMRMSAASLNRPDRFCRRMALDGRTEPFNNRVSFPVCRKVPQATRPGRLRRDARFPHH